MHAVASKLLATSAHDEVKTKAKNDARLCSCYQSKCFSSSGPHFVFGTHKITCHQTKPDAVSKRSKTNQPLTMLNESNMQIVSMNQKKIKQKIKPFSQQSELFDLHVVLCFKPV